ncbi:endonuclease III [Leptospira wolffii]|uniref:Endonuclease III n=1 Tax=Leptospira wolffii TaxID=409998 RepID=A0A2M9Z9G4_9LEPT|nr:endonuclease III [Leptospira wolffii]PJZ65065.1 endonuclease III [Leptospira wolffii]TGK56809.1 endonuclease III [Leptospira wolffii]TGK71609.1 endonuclease III [Leptospira wolffii]TGK75534.1 endonuclease III [Leptospira wolffii]TGL32976.1 endonuclease III [Leptospira wolffii]
MPPKNTSESKKRPSKPKFSATPEYVSRIYFLLRKEFGDVNSPLHYHKDYEFAISVILSAQCTDERVNEVSPHLFAAFPSLEALASAPLAKIEKIIYPTGFYRNKAKSVSGFANMLLNEYDGKLPKSIQELIKLPGIGRKTANVVLNEIHGISEGFVVDTHVKRVSKKLGLTEESDPVKVEKDLMKTVQAEYWMDLSLYFIFLGRKYCKAHRTFCETCVLNKECPSSSVT